MYWRRLAMRSISEVFSFAYALHRPVPGYRVLMYHSVGGSVIRDRLNIFGITEKLFVEHMNILSSRQVDVVNFDAKYQVGSRENIAITFDDGYKDNLLIAAPILIEHGFPFTVFVSTKFVKNKVKNFLTAHELKELSDLPNVTIGSHGVTHTPLTSCNDSKLKEELRDSKQYLEDVIGKPVTTIGYPHGAVDKRVRNAAYDFGYKTGATSYMDINRDAQDTLLLSRTSILGIDTPHVFKQKINGCWDWYKWRQKNPMYA